MIQNINKSCLGTGLIFGIWDVNMLCIAYEYRFNNTLINPPTQLLEPTSPMILSASIPFSLLQLEELPTVSYVETKKQRPSRHMLHALIHAYSLNNKVGIDKYESDIERLVPSLKKGSSRLMSTVRNWAFIYYALQARCSNRMISAMLFDLSGSQWRSLRARFLKHIDEYEYSELSNPCWDEISDRIWKCCTSSNFKCSEVTGCFDFLDSTLKLRGSKKFNTNELINLIKLWNTNLSSRSQRPDSYFKGDFSQFLKIYSKDLMGKHFSLTHKVIRKDGTARTIVEPNIYGQKIPANVVNKDSVYFFMGFAACLAVLCMKKYDLSEKSAALVSLYTLKHSPFFNYQPGKTSKQSSLWPQFINNNHLVAIISKVQSFLNYLKQSAHHDGPFDYCAWALKGFPDKWSEKYLNQIPSTEKNSELIKNFCGSFNKKHLKNTSHNPHRH